MSNRRSDHAFYFLVLVEVVFQTKDGVHVLKRQIFEKGDMPTFPAGRIHRLNNVAALQLKQSLPQDQQDSFHALDAYVLAITPLGRMTEKEFWAGMVPPSDQGDQKAPVAAPETTPGEDVPSSNNVVQGAFPDAPTRQEEAFADAHQAIQESEAQNGANEAEQAEPPAPQEDNNGPYN